MRNCAGRFRKILAALLVLSASVRVPLVDPSLAAPPQEAPAAEPAATPADTSHGLGWSRTGDVIRHAMLGVRVDLLPGWERALHARFPGEMTAYRLAIRHPGNDWGIRIQALTGRGLERDVLMDEAEGLDQRSWDSLSAGPPADFRFGEIHVRLFLRKEKSRDPKIMNWQIHRGTHWTGDRLLIFEVLSPNNQGHVLPKGLLDAMRAIHILDSDERAAMATGFAAGADPEAILGESYHHRRGTFIHVEHLFSWTKPDSIWDVEVPAGDGPPTNTLVSMSKAETGVTVDLLDLGDAKIVTRIKAHDALRTEVLSAGKVIDAPKPSTVKFAGRDATRSDTRILAARHPLRVTLVVVNSARRRMFGLYVVASDTPAAAADVESALDGFRFLDSPPPVPRRTASGWEDPQLGFLVSAPSGKATVEPLTRDIPTPGGRALLVRSGSGSLAVFALVTPQGASVPKPSSLILALDHTLGRPVATSEPDEGMDSVEGTLGGRPCRILVRRGPTPGVIAALMRDGLLFLVESTSTEAGREADALDWFTFVD